MLPGMRFTRKLEPHNSAHLVQIVDSHMMMYVFQGRYIPDLYDLCDLYELAHVAGWDPYNVRGLYYYIPVAHVPLVGSAL